MSWYNKIPVLGGLLPPDDQERIKDTKLQHGQEMYDSAGNIVKSAGNRSATGVAPTTIDQSQQGQFRSRQQALADMLERRANGTGGPSAAENQLSQASDRNLRQTQAMAASQRGGVTAMQGKDLQDRLSLSQNELAGTAATLRANESASALGQLGQVVGEGRGQDINLATSQAQIQQQQRMADAENELRSRGLNDEAIARAMQTQFGVDQYNAMLEQRTKESNADIQRGNLAANAAWQAGVTETAGSLASMGMKSDKNSKMDVRSQRAKSLKKYVTSDKETKTKVMNAGTKSARREALDEMIQKMDARDKPTPVVTPLDNTEELRRERPKSKKSAHQGQALDVPKLDDRVLSDKSAKKDVKRLADRAESSSRQKHERSEFSSDTMTRSDRDRQNKRTETVSGARSKALLAAAKRDATERNARAAARSVEPSISLDESLPVPYDTKKYQGSEYIKSDARAKEAAYKAGLADGAARHDTSDTVAPNEARPGRPITGMQKMPKPNKKELPAQGPAMWEEATRGMDPGSLLYAKTLDRVQGGDTYEQDYKKMHGEHVVSDERSKTDIDVLSDAIEPVTFKYKDRADGDGKWLGVIAQDVERGGQVGKDMVSTGPDGMKRLDRDKMASASLAMSAEALKRAASLAKALSNRKR